ncbi:unnamed protein product [Polarella glacialis]|uniref:BTB domain-containing protein n=1 Tax=Polarella glacialis TaxID=89957 RepID=A0A813K1P3_POLGL|nr:unnamed protein product [Polarella glacialis]
MTLAALRFAQQADDLEAAVMARLAEQAAELRGQLLVDLQQLRQEAMAEIAEMETQTISSLPGVPEAQPAMDSFSAALLEPTTAVRVNDCALHVHNHVLRQIPYFAALLEGQWQDAGAPKVNLPCSIEEFSLLLRRFYMGEPLGSAALPVDSCSSAIRLAAAAAMLLIDGSLPELSDILLASVKTAEDVKLSMAALGALPETLALTLRGIQESPELPSDVFEMIVDSRSSHSQEAASKILLSCRGRLDMSTLVKACGKLLEEASTQSWAAQLMREHLTCEHATEAFKAAGLACFCGPPHGNCVGTRRGPASKLYAEHVLRCAKAGSAKDAFWLGVAPPAAPEMATIKAKGGSCFWGNDEFNSFPITMFTSSTPADLLALAIQAVPHELPHIAAIMATMLPSQIASILNDDMLQALGVHLKLVIARLASDAHAALAWTSVIRLNLLPRESRRVLCAQLTSVLGAASPEVAVAIAGGIV